MNRRTAVVLALVGALVLAVATSASASRVLVEHVDGTICDVTPETILFLDGSGTLRLEDRATDAITSIPPVPDRVSHCGYVSPHGAVFPVSGPTVSDTHLYDFRDGSLIDLGFLNAQFKVTGDWAIWSSNQTLRRRDLQNGTTVTVSTEAGNTQNDVDASGNVVYWSVTPSSTPYQIFRFDGSSSTQLSNDATLWNTYPLTDGVNVVYRKTTPCCFNEHGSVAVFTSSGETVLNSARDAWPERGFDYQAAGGWVAYTRPGPATEFQVWLRSPSGTESVVTPTGLSVGIIALSPEGDVIWTSRYPAPPTDYFLTRRGGPRIDLGNRGGNFFWDNGWYQRSGGTVYRIVPDADAYPRPKGASPFRASLVTAYVPCTSPDRTHGAPLAFPSCSPPTLRSQYLTVGTYDSNAHNALSQGYLRIDAVSGNPGTWADEADARIQFGYTDVFNKDLTDYTGELRPSVAIRRTDRNNAEPLKSGAIDHFDSTYDTNIEITTTTPHGLSDGALVDVSPQEIGKFGCGLFGPFTVSVTGPTTFTLDNTDGCGASGTGGSWQETGTPDPGPATGTLFPIAFSAPCVDTPSDADAGSSCAASTTADALVPGMVRELDRSVWEFDQVVVFDGGADGDGDTTGDNTIFAKQGVFVP